MHRRHPLLLALLLGLALLGLPVLAAGSASAAEPCTPGPTCLATRVQIVGAPAKAVYKHTMTIIGRLDAQDPTTQDYGWVSGQTVTLQRKLAGASDFTAIGDAVTGDQGKVTFTTPASKNAQYQLVYAGGTYAFPDGSGSVDLAPSSSTPHGIQVYRDLHEHDVQKGGKIFLAGNVDPGWGGKSIYLQRKTCAKCTWKAYAKQQTSSTCGWQFRTPAPAHGSWYWRAYVPATSDYLKTTSAVLRTYTTYL